MSRLARLQELVAARELDLVVVGDLVRPGDSDRAAMANLRYLAGFGGTSGLCVVGEGSATFLTDFRYAERAEREVDPGFERKIAEGQVLPALAELLDGRVGYDDVSTSVRSLRRLEELAPADAELVPAAGLVEGLRRHKDAAELEAISAAQRIAEDVYGWIAERGLAGRTEREVALGAEQRMRELGAEGPSFPAIVAAGENGALPHAEPGDREIGAAELVVIDLGAIVDGYCSDCTRTLATGELEPGAREVYELVLAAQRAAAAAVRPDATGRAVDSVAREMIANAGHGDAFGHGLGHGVGIEIHEAPRLAKTADDVLERGDVVTVEPGIYLPGRFGVRIEDMVTVTEDGSRSLASFPKDLQVVG